MPPKKLRDFAPTYPVNLRGTGTSGSVVMQARIALDGFLTDIRVVGDAHPDLANAAVAAVREWHYSETLLNCAPVEVGMTITANFKDAAASTGAAETIALTYRDPVSK